MADALDLGSSVLTDVGVQVPSRAQIPGRFAGFACRVFERTRTHEGDPENAHSPATTSDRSAKIGDRRPKWTGHRTGTGPPVIPPLIPRRHHWNS